MSQHHKKYRSESFRLYNWDYRSEGAYFITICTKNRKHFFGECIEGKMKLSTMGIIAQGCWFQIPRYNHNITLGEFIVMPNHIHDILIIVPTTSNDVIYNIATKEKNISTTEDKIATKEKNISTEEKHPYFQKISPKSGSISRIIQQYKRSVTYHVRQAFPKTQFGWQSLFHDHIIRNNKAFQNISNYIANNPLAWKEDTFSKQNKKAFNKHNSLKTKKNTTKQ